jgi:uncharacterized protein YyaL (SSP411 family)
MNRLADETSLYLRQHAENPVDWYPWGEAALERARAEDKPLFVSIGYAACHWCHVMAHESFEDERIAALLARSFVAVKVDREERPDLDSVYMAATQALTGSGGWPMSVFCTPDGRPFFAGTYFPPTDRPGMPSFSRVLDALADAWSTKRPLIEEQADALADAVRRQVALADVLASDLDAPALVFDDLLDTVAAQLARSFDAELGGFGPAPKFPRPTFVELCLRHHARRNSAQSLELATRTLDAMAAGGIYDHLAGGFARYSTDRHWLVPHFEKMLTDQALLARAYLHAWQLTGRAEYRQVLDETLDWVLSGLSDKDGGLFSSVDADAGGVEGAHATFTLAEARRAFDEAGRPDLAEATLAWYGITERGNWEGTNVPHRPLGAPLLRPPEVEAGRAILLAARSERVQPAIDDKVLTEWNAMAASALAEAAAATGEGRWAAAAERICDLLFDGSRRADGRWLRSRQEGKARHLAFAADYAWLVDACTRLGELTGAARWTDRATETAHGLLDLFLDEDGDRRVLYSTGHDAEALVVRPQEFGDGAVPSPNSVAAGALIRLGALTGVDRFREVGEGLVRTAAALLAESPLALADLIGAVGLQEDLVEVVVAGDRPDLVSTVRRRWLPGAVLAWGERTASALWEGRTDGSAYVCRRFVCRSPAGDPTTLEAELPDPGS